MVWIPGGMFEFHGTAAMPWYDGSRFARDGIVCVTINYRVGVEGFLYLSEGNANRALLDQIAALQWVKENIAAFGGDPGNVTIFGESAGAMSVATLLALPAAQGLFHRAIAQSGAASNTFAPEVASEVTATTMARLGVTDLDGLVAADSGALVDAAASITAGLIRDPFKIAGRTGISVALAFEPVVDGEWLPTAPLEAVAKGDAADVPLLIGTNRDEWNLFRILSRGVRDR